MNTTKERCTLRELESATLFLDDQEKEQLESCSMTFGNAKKKSKARINVFPSSTSGQYIVIPKSVVGVVETTRKTILIQPKIGIRNLLFLVAYCWDPRDWNQKLAFLEYTEAHTEVLNLLEAIALSFATVLQQTFQKNVLQGYSTVEGSENTVRGRVNFQQQILFDQAPPIECIYDEFTEDILENQIIKAALHRLVSLRQLSANVRNRVRILHSRLDSVSDRHFHETVPEVHFTPLNEHYSQALAISRFLLSRSATLKFQHGAVAVPSFLLSMSKTFEDFVVCALRASKSLQPLFPTRANFVQNKSISFDTQGKVEIKPDLSYWSGGRCIFLADAKYKVLSDRKHKKGKAVNEVVLTPDLYQLLSYVIATKLRYGMLIYAESLPAQQNSAPSVPIRYPDLTPANTNVHLLRRGLNLAVEPAHLIAQIEDLGAEIHHICVRQA